jgi:hypothetical protein
MVIGSLPSLLAGTTPRLKIAHPGRKGKPMTSIDPRRRFRVLLWSALAASALLTPLALAWLAADGPLRLHVALSVTLGITLSLLLAAALMGLVFWSAASGHDERVAEENAGSEPDQWRDV